MRYDTPVFFQIVTQGKYDSSTGDYGKESIEEVKKYACVGCTSVEILKIVYGCLRQGSVTIQLQNHYNEAFDRIRVGNKLYRVDYSKKHRVKQVFIVSEVQ